MVSEASGWLYQRTYPGKGDIRKLLFAVGASNIGMIPCHPTLFKVLRGSFKSEALPQSDIKPKPMLVEGHNVVGVLDVISKR